jgi:CheY-like chemotaxis protein
LSKGSTKYQILLVEDNQDDVLITKRAINKCKIINNLFVVNNGEEALKYFRKEGEYRDTFTPSLVLLDLKMPKLDGFEVLKEVKGDKKLKIIPIIVLTSSGRGEDIEKAYKLGCNSYITKPVKFEDFIKIIGEVDHYWFEISKTPVNQGGEII